jgi:hypothetical protein
MSPLIDALPDEIMKDQSAAANDQAMSRAIRRNLHARAQGRLQAYRGRSPGLHFRFKISSENASGMIQPFSLSWLLP